MKSRPGLGCHRDRHRPRARPRRRLYEPHAPPLRQARPDPKADLARRRTAKLPFADRQGPQGLRALARSAHPRQVGAVLGRLSDTQQGELVSALRTAEGLMSEQAKTARRRRAAASPSPAISAGSSRAMPRSTRRNTVGAETSRASARRSSRISSKGSIRSASAAGSPRSAAATSARCSWRGIPTRWRGCDCCWSSRRRAGSASASGFDPTNACGFCAAMRLLQAQNHAVDPQRALPRRGTSTAQAVASV